MLREENTVLLSIDLGDSRFGGFAPGQKHHPVVSHAIHKTDGLLRENLPSPVGVTRGLVRSHRQRRVEHQNTPFGPGGE